ncbi:MAG: aminopeptidase N [Syntrophotaleaceae bacterium]
MDDTNNRTVRLKDYTPPEFLVEKTDLRFDLDEEFTEVRARLEIRRNPVSSGGRASLVLQGRDLELLELRLSGRVLEKDRYHVDDQTLTIESVPEELVLESLVRIRPRDNTALEGLYLSSGIFCTQCEAEGFRKITYFPDRPDVLSRFTTTIAADRERFPVLLSNGNSLSCRDLEGGRHEMTWTDPFAKPCYLFALVAGRLECLEDYFITVSGKKVLLQIFVEKHNLHKCDHAMIALKKAMRWDEQVYGLEYDLDQYMIVAVDDFNMGAMENKGLNVFNSKYVLAKPETATDADYQAIEEVIGHEYFHNWTGNRVTCRDWFQLSLKEGLTVFRDQEFSADQVSRAIKRIQDVRDLRTVQFAEDAGPLAHSVRPESYQEINNFYTATVYHKGAEVVRMIQTLLGPDRFRKGVRLYLQRHDGQAATVEDFLQAMEDVSGRTLAQFRLWYSQAGTPTLRVNCRHDPQGQVFEINVRQNCPPTPGQSQKQPFHIPLSMALLDAAGREIPLRLEGEESGEGLPVRVLEVMGETHTYRFTGIATRPVPSLLRGFSAPVRLEDDLDEGDRAFLLQFDQDSFCRWEAGQHIANRAILDLVPLRPDADTEAILPEPLVKGFRQVLQDENLDRGLAAQLLSLPSELYLAELMEEIDVEGIFMAREAVRRGLAGRLQEDFLAGWRKNQESGPYDVQPGSVARRSFKNLCLDYLTTLGGDNHRLLLESYRQAGNMTDKIAALNLLANCDIAERRMALEDFFRFSANDPLVLDKWFAVQARSRLPETLEVVVRLTTHPAFNFNNPNRVRSLLGVFSRGNPLRFHAADGSGYAFLSEQILRIDRQNPQLAARLAEAFGSWRRFEPVRRKQMHMHLTGMAKEKHLSRDLAEVVTRALRGV